MNAVNSFISLRDAIDDYLGRLLALDERLSGSEPHALTQQNLGWPKGSLVMLAGLPQSGKTALVIDMARSAAQANQKVALFSYEMNELRVTERLLSSYARIPVDRIRKGQWTFTENSAITEAKVKLSKLSLEVCDAFDMDVREVARQARGMKATKGLDLVVVDNLQAMQRTAYSQLTGEPSLVQRNIVMELKEVARLTNVAVLLVYQINGEPRQRTGTDGLLADLGFAEAAHHAGVVMVVHKKLPPLNTKEWDLAYPGEVFPAWFIDVTVGKDLQGPILDFSLAFQPQFSRFVHLKRGIA